NVVVGYAGIELAAFHAADAKDPQRDYGRAILLSSVLIVMLYVIGTAALIVVLPQGDIDRIGGLVQFFHVFFHDSQFDVVTKIVSIVLALGSLGATNTWLISPAKGVFAAMEHFQFPDWMTKTNEHDVPVPLLVVQASLCSILLIGMSLTHSSDQCFWLLIALTTQFSVILYILMAIAVRELRVLQPLTHRPFAIPASWLNIVVWITILVCSFVMLSTLIPVENITGWDLLKYEAVFLLGWIVLSFPPVLFRNKITSSVKE
ncbi:MAG: amino acid permease, partial [Gammaproteobacteria bacterium]|nr:amino acid permease [Gammaproteobacteria bacterium]